MRIQLPDPGIGPHASPLRAAFDAIRRAFLGVVSTEEAVPYVHLQASDRSVWRVEISTGGVLQTTKVQG